MRDGGKGDAPRPMGVPMDQFDSNWDAIFATAKSIKQNIKQVNAEFDKAYNQWNQNNIEPIPFAGMVDTGEDDVSE